MIARSGTGHGTRAMGTGRETRGNRTRGTWLRASLRTLGVAALDCAVCHTWWTWFFTVAESIAGVGTSSVRPTALFSTCSMVNLDILGPMDCTLPALALATMATRQNAATLLSALVFALRHINGACDCHLVVAMTDLLLDWHWAPDRAEILCLPARESGHRMPAR